MEARNWWDFLPRTILTDVFVALSEIPVALFPTTQWSRVARAGDPDEPEARAALEGLCRDYWYPLYALARRRGFDRDEAGDIVQGFLADLLERGDLVTADPSRGRFRSFLRAACIHFMERRRQHDRALKRGGGIRPISIDLTDAEGRYGREPSHDLTAERLFERRWALDILCRVLSRVEREAVEAGKGELFTRLHSVLEGDVRAESYREIAESLGMSDAAVKMAAHRLRCRFREVFREEVARTLTDPADVQAEMVDLMTALA
jgi:RNA polymerase sigma-70 factor (ECF subfamily)